MIVVVVGGAGAAAAACGGRCGGGTLQQSAGSVSLGVDNGKVDRRTQARGEVPRFSASHGKNPGTVTEGFKQQDAADQATRLPRSCISILP